MKKLIISMLLLAAAAMAQQRPIRPYGGWERPPHNVASGGYYSTYPAYSYPVMYPRGGVWTGVGATAVGAAIAIAAGETNRRLDEAAYRRQNPRPVAKVTECSEFVGEKSRLMRCKVDGEWQVFEMEK